MGKIVEYVGDGGGSAKPWPAMFGSPGEQASALATLLELDHPPLVGTIRRYSVNWYRLPTLTYSTTLLVCLQPTANEDADLFLLNGNGYYSSGAALIGYSNRVPTAGTGDWVAGFVPDWVAFTKGATGGKPAAYADVFGLPGGVWRQHYRIESHEVLPISTGVGGLINQYQSHWWYFDATSGTHYTVHLTANSGDPDVYVYEDRSIEFVGSNSAGGGGDVGFTAAETGRHYVRVYGFSASNGYNLDVTQP